MTAPSPASENSGAFKVNSIYGKREKDRYLEEEFLLAVVDDRQHSSCI